MAQKQSVPFINEEHLTDNLPHNSPVHHEVSAPRWVMIMGTVLVMVAALLAAAILIR